MSVNHNWFGRVAVKFRWTWSSWTGGPALPLRPRFFANTDQSRCWEHSRQTRFSPATRPAWLSSSEMNRQPNAGSSWGASHAALVRWASSQSRYETGFRSHW